MSTPLNGDPPPAALLIVSSEIKRLRELNSLLPINKAPFEILATIFELVGDAYAPSELGRDNGSPSLVRSIRSTVYSIHAVCYSWRMAALNIPALWSTIPTLVDLQNSFPSQIFDLHCSRVGPYPLRIRASVYLSDPHELIDQLYIQDCALDTLNLSIKDIGVCPAILLCKPHCHSVVECLRDLTLRFITGRVDHVQQVDLTGATSLKHLRILLPEYHVVVDWAELAMPRLLGAVTPQLQSFHLYGVFDPRDIITLLQGCATSLNTFYWATGEISEDDVMSQRGNRPVHSVHLPQLTSLSCQGGTANSLLTRISVSERLETLKCCSAGEGLFDPLVPDPPTSRSHLNQNLFTRKIPSLRNLVLDWVADMSLFPYARAQTKLETLCGELWQLGYLFTTSSANPPQGFDRTLFPGLRWVHVSFDEDMMNEEFGTLMSLLEMSAGRQAPFLVFLGKNEWRWWDGLRLSNNEDMRALYQHSSIVYEAKWDPWKSDFDPKKVLEDMR